jgi:hypothetical protein
VFTSVGVDAVGELAVTTVLVMPCTFLRCCCGVKRWSMRQRLGLRVQAAVWIFLQDISGTATELETMSPST